MMVMDLLGLSLEELFHKCGKIFTLKTAIIIGDQMVKRIEFLHMNNFLHRDIKVCLFL